MGLLMVLGISACSDGQLKDGKTSVLYQIMNLVYSNGELQRKRFAEFVSKKNNALFDVKYAFLQDERMEGVVVGGNEELDGRKKDYYHWLFWEREKYICKEAS